MKVEVITVGPIEVNCLVVYCECHMAGIIVDPGDSGKRIISFIEQKRIIPKLIVNTHCHADHTGGVGTLVDHFGIPFLCHPEDVPLLLSKESKEMAHYMGLKTPPPNDATVADDEVLDLCDDFALTVLHTPGHTRGGICLRADGFVIVGDTLFKNSVGRSDLTGGDHETLIRSIRERLFVLPDDTTVYPGHGDTTSIGYEKAHNPFLRQTEGYT